MHTATLVVDPRFEIGAVNRRLFGSFVEHLGRCVYEGIYEPSHPSADSNGFRRDVIELVRELGVTTVRYPGGNFVSGYDWEDGIGPKADRPTRIDPAWHSTETNQVGLDDFVDWARAAGVEVMYAVNLGTRGVAEALAVLEYANLAAGSTRAEQRAANGHPEPHGIRMWCLGNEMDGPWQIGYSSAEAYGTKAAQVAKAMLQVDPGLELVACGSSGAHIETFGAWEQTVLRKTYADITHISCHAYYEESGGDVASFLASGVDMDFFIEGIVATADAIGAELHDPKRVLISFDEWNVWYSTRYHDVERITHPQEWPSAPRLLEDVYTVVDAVVVGDLLISLLNHADRVASASLAQLVNVIAPIMTEPGGPAWRQTTFFPFALTSRHASGAALQVRIGGAQISTAKYGVVNVLSAAATWDSATSTGAFFLVNRDHRATTQAAIDVSGFDGVRIADALTMADSDLSAVNDRRDPDRVGLTPNDTAAIRDGVLTIRLPPASWTCITVTTTD